MMTRRQFRKIADALRYEAEKLLAAPVDTTEYLQGRRDQLNALTAALAAVCASENPNFDHARFLAACKPKGG